MVDWLWQIETQFCDFLFPAREQSSFLEEYVFFIDIYVNILLVVIVLIQLICDFIFLLKLKKIVCNKYVFSLPVSGLFYIWELGCFVEYLKVMFYFEKCLVI